MPMYVVTGCPYVKAMYQLTFWSTGFKILLPSIAFSQDLSQKIELGRPRRFGKHRVGWRQIFAMAIKHYEIH